MAKALDITLIVVKTPRVSGVVNRRLDVFRNGNTKGSDQMAGAPGAKPAARPDHNKGGEPEGVSGKESETRLITRID